LPEKKNEERDLVEAFSFVPFPYLLVLTRFESVTFESVFPHKIRSLQLCLPSCRPWKLRRMVESMYGQRAGGQYIINTITKNAAHSQFP
jgi:hypothetical protein